MNETASLQNTPSLPIPTPPGPTHPESPYTLRRLGARVNARRGAGGVNERRGAGPPGARGASGHEAHNL
jgi:hypothetical protein